MKRFLSNTAILALIVALVGCGRGTSVKEARELAFKEDLYTLRNAIDQFTQDEKRAPESLEDLMTHGYLRDIPLDPFTNSRTTWQLIYDDSNQAPQDVPAAPPRQAPRPKGIIDVHGGSDQVGSNGKRYRDW